MNKLPISVIIITKDEEHNIQELLYTLEDFSEIVVVDAESSDRTRELAERHGAKVFIRKWTNYSDQKQYAISLTKNDWIFSIDADERVTSELKEEIRKIFNNKIEYNGFYIPRKNYFLGRWIRHSGWWPDYVLRLFNKNFAKYDSRLVHEKIIISGKTMKLNSPIEHYTYKTISQFIHKLDTYSYLASQEILKNRPSRASLIINLLSRPLFTFIKMFILQRGYLDGRYGFYLACLYSFYTYLKYMRALEEEGDNTD